MIISRLKIPILLGDILNQSSFANKNIMIFDIETTGFSRDNAIIYMIGCIYKKDGNYEYCNIFADELGEEPKVIEYFFSLLKEIKYLIHFNGDRFDIPFLLARAAKYGIEDRIITAKSVDAYKLLTPFRKSLGLPNLKLNTVQSALGYQREDILDGGELIKVYNSYIHHTSEQNYKILVLHNKEDVEGMINIVPLIDTIQLINNITSGNNTSFTHFNQCDDYIKVVYKLPLTTFIDITLTLDDSVLRFSSNSSDVELSLPVHYETKKLFFENYKDYVYIPDRDEVVHKSVAMFMSTSAKVKATKGNCYLRHTDFFIPLFSTQKVPKVFKDEINSKGSFTIITPELTHVFWESQLIGFIKSCLNN